MTQIKPRPTARKSAGQILREVRAEVKAKTDLDAILTRNQKTAYRLLDVDGIEQYPELIAIAHVYATLAIATEMSLSE